MMAEWLETAIEIILALGALLLFALAFGLAIDNHAARLDPASPYHSSIRP